MSSGLARVSRLVGQIGLVCVCSAALAQIPANMPQGASLQGTIVVLGPGKIGMFSSDGGRWMVQFTDRTSIMVTGTTDATALRPGMCVKFQADVNRARKVVRPIERIQVFTATRQDLPGATPSRAAGPAAEAKAGGPGPAQGAEAAETTTRYDVIGRVAGIQKGKIVVSLGRGSIEIEPAQNLAVDLAMADISLARAGDQITCYGVLASLGTTRTFRASSIQVSKAAPAQKAAQGSAEGTGSAGKDAKGGEPEAARKPSDELIALLTPKQTKDTGETFRIENDPTEFRVSQRLAAAVLERRFGAAQKSAVKGQLVVRGHLKPGSWQMWSWNGVKVIVDQARKARFFAVR